MTFKNRITNIKPVDTELIIREFLSKKNWDMLYQSNILRKDMDNGVIDAHIDMLKWVITLEFDNKFEEKIRYHNAKCGFNFDNPIKKTIEMVLEHEMNHWKICPGDIVYLEMLMDTVSKGLEDGGLKKADIPTVTPYMSNFFSDIIINSIASVDRNYTDGFFLLYGQRLNSTHKQSIFSQINKNSSNTDLVFDIFCDVQAKIFGNTVNERSIVEIGTSNYNRVKDYVTKLLCALSSPIHANDIYSKKIDAKSTDELLSKFKKEDNWGPMAYTTAKLLAPLFNNINEEKLDEMFPLSGPIKKFVEDKNYRKMVVENGIGRGSELKYIKKFENYDEQYRKKAGIIVIESNADSEEKHSLTICKMGLDEADKNNPSSIYWPNTIIAGDQLLLNQKPLPFNMNFEGNTLVGSMQDILFIVDTSGSMDWSGYPFDNSKYDLSLQSFYAMVNYLEKIKKASFLNYGLIQFSNNTIWSKWHSYYELDNVKKALFDMYEGNRTHLDPKILNEALKTKRDKFMAVMISDGEIENSRDVINSCTEMISEGNDFILLQIASRDNFANQIASKGGTVVNIDNPKDMINLVLSATKRKYDRVVRRNTS